MISIAVVLELSRKPAAIKVRALLLLLRSMKTSTNFMPLNQPQLELIVFQI